jgi:hypothetical protein
MPKKTERRPSSSGLPGICALEIRFDASLAMWLCTVTLKVGMAVLRVLQGDEGDEKSLPSVSSGDKYRMLIVRNDCEQRQTGISNESQITYQLSLSASSGHHQDPSSRRQR